MVERTVVGLLNRTPRGVARLFPPQSRAARLAKPVVDRLVPARDVAITVRGGPVAGARMSIDSRHEKYYWTGLHEVEVQQALARLIEPGMTCWDMGAHAGFFTLLMSRATGSTGAVHAFEPAPESARRLEWAIAENRLDNVRRHDVAVGGEDGDGTLHLGRSSLTSTLVPGRGEHARAVGVRCRTIDSLAEEFGVPDVIKIDVEGLELEALRGGGRVFGEGRPKAVVELASPDRERAALELLPGYAATRISPSNWVFEPRD